MIEVERDASKTLAELREVTDGLADVSERLAERVEVIRRRIEARDRNVTRNFS